MSLQSEHPPTQELNETPTTALVMEIEMYRASKATDDDFTITPMMERRILDAQCELARRFRKGWAATGNHPGGGVQVGS